VLTEPRVRPGSGAHACPRLPSEPKKGRNDGTVSPRATRLLSSARGLSRGLQAGPAPGRPKAALTARRRPRAGWRGAGRPCAPRCPLRCAHQPRGCPHTAPGLRPPRPGSGGRRVRVSQQDPGTTIKARPYTVILWKGASSPTTGPVWLANWLSAVP
jgi:hypothetical protein